MRLAFAAVAALALSSAAIAKPATPEYRLVKTVALGGPDDWDFVHFDPAQDRVYVAHGNEVTVVDGRRGNVVGRVTGIAGAHDVATVPALGRGYADNGDTGVVTVFDLRTLRTIGTIPADKDADAMVYDPATKRLVVGSGDARDASIINPATGKKIATIPLGGTAESMAIEGVHGRVFINVDTANEIARLNLHTNRIDARWPTPGCEAPHGLAIDNAGRRLFASCRNSKMIVISATTGKSLALLPIGAGTDSAGFDPRRMLAFSANKDGTLSIVSAGPGETFNSRNISTAPGAKNMAIDPRTGRIFLVTATIAATRSPSRPGGTAAYDFAPGSVKLMILDPTH